MIVFDMCLHYSHLMLQFVKISIENELFLYLSMCNTRILHRNTCILSFRNWTALEEITRIIRKVDISIFNNRFTREISLNPFISLTRHNKIEQTT